MSEYKSLDYLKEIKDSNVMTKSDLIDMLQNIGYILGDNDYQSARFFLDDIIELIENDEVDL